MEGLIPFLLHSLKKERPYNTHQGHHSFSEGSNNRSYHMLMGSDSFTGSSHRRTRSDFQPSTVDQFMQQRSGLEFGNSLSFNNGSKFTDSTTNGPRQIGSSGNTYQVSKETNTFIRR